MWEPSSMARREPSAAVTEEEMTAQQAVSDLRDSFMAKRTLPEAWRREQLMALQRMLQENREKFVQALHQDLHKSEVEAYYTEMNLVEHELQQMLDELHELMQPEKVPTNLLNIPGWGRIYKDPLGVVCIMGVWNYPIQLTLMPLVGAIAAGNCVVLKPPSLKHAKACAEAIAELIPKYMDQSCIRVLEDEGDRVMAEAILKQRYDKIFFTGGPLMGQKVAEAAARFMTPVVLELGGKSPAIICPSADITIAAKRISWGAFMNSGQTCVRPDYVLVHRDVADQFLQELKEAVISMYGENPEQNEYYGRVINADNHKRLMKVLDDAKTKKKANILIGGDGSSDEKYIAPTVLDYGEDEAAFRDSTAMAEEIFGPILAVLRFSEFQRAIDFVREGEKPLSVYPFTTKSEDTELILRETSSGGCDVNDVMMRLSNPNLPFGGVGFSGMGAYHGVSSFMTFSHRKSVNFKINYLDMPVRYPPYVDWKRSMLAIAQQVRPASQVRMVKRLAALVAFFVVRRLGWPSDVLCGIIRLLLGGQQLTNR